MGAIYHNHGSMRAHSSSLGPQRPDIAQQVCTKGEMTCVQIPRRHLAQQTQNGHFCIVMNDGFTLAFIVKIVSKDHQTLFQSTWKKVNKMKNEGWGGGLSNLRFGSFDWALSLGIACLEISVWEFSLDEELYVEEPFCSLANTPYC